MEHQDQHMRSLYLEFLDNRLSEQEVSDLFQKMRRMPQDDLEAMLAEVMIGDEIHPVEGEKESLERILQSIRTRRLTSKSSPRISLGLYSKWIAAAVVLLLPTLVYFMYSQQTDSHQIEIAKGSADIEPGRDRAVLRLANGTEIFLDTLHAGQNKIKQDGASISKEGSGKLVYIKLEEAENKEVEYNTITTPRGGRYKVLLPDSTQVWLNSSSSISYPTSFAHAKTRTVKLGGEAYFEVKKMSDRNGKSQPFVVSTNEQQIKVLGTQFNVNAYADEPSAKTTLIEGRVEVNSDKILQPGQQAISFDDTLEIKSVDANSYIDWKNDEFNLKNSDFRTTMRKIARWYDIEVIYDQSAPKDVKLGGWISRDKNISSVLNLIQKTANVHFKLEGRRVIVSK